MSKRAHRRFNSNPVPVHQNFESLVKPIPFMDFSTFNSNLFTTRIQTPQVFATFNHKNSRKRTSSKDHKKAQFSFETSPITLERTQAVIEQNKVLKRQLEKKRSCSIELFKNDAVLWTKADYLKKLPKDNDFKATIPLSVSSVVEIIDWILEQKEEVPIKLIKSSVLQARSILKTAGVDIEAKVQIIIADYQEKINNLQREINKITEINNAQQESTIKLLINKNLELSDRILRLETEIHDQKVKIT